MPVFPDGTRVKVAEWNRLISSISSDYTIAKIGSTYHGEANIASGTDYEDSNADDLFLYVHDALPSGGTVAVKRANYLKSKTLEITKNYQTWMFEPGTKITHSGSAEAIKVGSDAGSIVRTNLKGNFTQITRASKGGTYGIHLENAHVCTVDGFWLENFSDAFIYAEGSWGSTIRRVEMNQVAANRADYGIMFRYTQAGANQYHQNNLMKITECWLTGNTAAVWIRDDQTPGTGSPQLVSFRECDFHDTPKGVLVDAGHNIIFDGNYWENITGYLVHLQGSDKEIGNTHFIRNILWLSAAQTGIYVDNASNVIIGFNSVFATATSKFIDTPADATNRYIHIFPNRIDAGTEYDGNAESLMYHHDSADFNLLLLGNNAPLKWRNAAGTPQEILKLASDDNLTLQNPDGHIYIAPKDGSQTIVGLNSTGDIHLGYGATIPVKIYLKASTSTDVTDGYLYVNDYINTDGVFKKGGVQVVGAQAAAIANVGAGDADSDGTARAKIDAILAALRAHGLIAT